MFRQSHKDCCLGLEWTVCVLIVYNKALDSMCTFSMRTGADVLFFNINYLVWDKSIDYVLNLRAFWNIVLLWGKWVAGGVMCMHHWVPWCLLQYHTSTHEDDRNVVTRLFTVWEFSHSALFLHFSTYNFLNLFYSPFIYSFLPLSIFYLITPNQYPLDNVWFCSILDLRTLTIMF